jgi:hypothetical protein
MNAPMTVMMTVITYTVGVAQHHLDHLNDEHRQNRSEGVGDAGAR